MIYCFASHLAWGAWIEIFWLMKLLCLLIVAPRMGCVDWNGIKVTRTRWINVAPRMGCVDWNVPELEELDFLSVAPRMGCVDWNCNVWFWWFTVSRRTSHGVRGLKLPIALNLNAVSESHLAWGAWIEIIDRLNTTPYQSSHLAWGAWIEIVCSDSDDMLYRVAPRMGCVDWNMKSSSGMSHNIMSHLAWGAWIEIS